MITQHLSTCLIVHLDQIINCLLLTFTVVVMPVISVNAKFLHRKGTAIIEELLVYSAKVVPLLIQSIVICMDITFTLLMVAEILLQQIERSIIRLKSMCLQLKKATKSDLK